MTHDQWRGMGLLTLVVALGQIALCGAWLYAHRLNLGDAWIWYAAWLSIAAGAFVVVGLLLWVGW